ncbi:hypothetical protein HMPREF1531_02356 [Propionibacterium sp. oral taxon 192 str. F0372]|uniref:hypothetical protein n=1 Tax=Propionibacterium sp. oral taxon 192 TaxID=671222 RepID=UPI000352CDCE|nr:hypothetical protein [Propionibacterium sp. oral taxon 192]EPH00248.1 hypothetical protein HMPREF1531_02356 [Propionibacterium sp. oral taxon 192 str. F0372]
MDDFEKDLADLLSRVPAPAYDPELIEETIMNTPSDNPRRPLIIVVVILSLLVIGMGVALMTREKGPIRAVDPHNSGTAQTSIPSVTSNSPTSSLSAQPSESITEPIPADTTASTPESPSSGPSADSDHTDPASAPTRVYNEKAYWNTGGAGQGYYFVSPSGNFLCGITEGSVGCQSKVPVAGMEQCGTNPRVRAAWVAWSPQTPISAECTTQGNYVTEQPGMVLDYGSELAAWDGVCASAPEGITCRSKTTGSRFTISTDGIQIHG